MKKKKQETTESLARKVSRGDFEKKGAIDLFKKLAPEKNAQDDYKQLSMPMIIRPSQMPGKVISGEVIGLIDSPVKGFKNKLLMMQNDGTAFAFPVTTTIERSLQQHLQEKLTPENVKGLKLLIKGLGKVQTSDGKRSVNIFEVYVK